MVSQGVAGVIVSPVRETVPDLLTATFNRGILTVVCVMDIPGNKAVFVGVDEERSGRLAARHLIENGNRNSR